MLNTATPRRGRRCNDSLRSIYLVRSSYVRSSYEVRSLLFKNHRYKLAAWVSQNCCERLYLSLGGEWAEQRSCRNLLWIAWGNGTRVAYALIEQEMCINFAQLYLRNGYKPKNSIATGPLYVHTEFETNWTLLPEDVAVWNPMGNQVS